MAYTKTSWTNGTAPYINADALNKIENGIYANDQASTEHANAITQNTNSINNNTNSITKLDNILGFESYSTSSTYDVGDYAVYNNKLYKCNTAIASGESFDSSKWDEINVKDIVSDTSSASTLETMITSVGITKTISGVTSASGTQDFNNAGYKPIAIVGFSTNNSHFVLNAHHLSSIGDGTATLTYTIGHSSSSSETGTVTVYMMWIRLV